MNFIKSHEVYKGRRVLLEESSYMDKNNKVTVMEHVKVNPAVVILPITKDDEIVFIKEKRTAIGNIELLEIPAGVIEDGEDPKESAIRELKEETGYVTNDVEFLTKYFPSCGYSNEEIFVYLARNLKLKQEQELDETEEIKVVEINKDKAFKILEEGKISNAATQIALMWYKLFKEGL